MDSARLPATVPRPACSLRSQLALDLLTKAGNKLTLEDVIRLKHSYRMLLADRVKPDLLAAIRSATRHLAGEAERSSAAGTTPPRTSRGAGCCSRPGGAGTARRGPGTSGPTRWSGARRSPPLRREGWPIRPARSPRYGPRFPRCGSATAGSTCPGARCTGCRVGGKDVPVGAAARLWAASGCSSSGTQPDGKRAVSGAATAGCWRWNSATRAQGLLGAGLRQEQSSRIAPITATRGSCSRRGSSSGCRSPADIEAQAVKRYRPGHVSERAERLSGRSPRLRKVEQEVG